MRSFISFVVAALLMAPACAKGTQVEPGQAGSRSHSPAAVKHYDKAVDLHKAGSLSQALTEYQAAVKDDAQFAQAWGNMAAIYSSKKQYAKAVEAYEKSIAIEPQAMTMSAYGATLFEMGKTDEAIGQWTKAIDFDPTFTSAYHNLAFALDKAGRHDEARAVRFKGGLLDKDGKAIEPQPE
jgi:tetratricopeptide (TPR) repeat protein